MFSRGLLESALDPLTDPVKLENPKDDIWLMRDLVTSSPVTAMETGRLPLPALLADMERVCGPARAPPRCLLTPKDGEEEDDSSTERVFSTMASTILREKLRDA